MLDEAAEEFLFLDQQGKFEHAEDFFLDFSASLTPASPTTSSGLPSEASSPNGDAPFPSPFEELPNSPVGIQDQVWEPVKKVRAGDDERKRKNREYARKSRAKIKDQLAHCQSRCAELESENRALTSRLQAMALELARACEALRTHEGRGGSDGPAGLQQGELPLPAKMGSGGSLLSLSSPKRKVAAGTAFLFVFVFSFSCFVFSSADGNFLQQ